MNPTPRPPPKFVIGDRVKPLDTDACFFAAGGKFHSPEAGTAARETMSHRPNVVVRWDCAPKAPRNLHEDHLQPLKA